MYHGCYIITLSGYVLLMCQIFGMFLFLGADTALLVMFYGLYFGVLSRCVDFYVVELLVVERKRVLASTDTALRVVFCGLCFGVFFSLVFSLSSFVD